MVTRLSPAACRRGHRRRADGAAAPGPVARSCGRRCATPEPRDNFRADSGFYTHAMVAVCRKMDVRFSITVRQHQSLRNLIEPYPRRTGRRSPIGWTAPLTWPRLNTHPSSMSPTPRQRGSSLPTPGSQLRCVPTASRLITTDHPGTLPRSTPSATDRGPQPSPLRPLRRQRRLAGGAGHRPQSGSLDWSGPGGYHQGGDAAGRLTRKARRLTLHLPQHWPMLKTKSCLVPAESPATDPPSASALSSRPFNRLRLGTA